jgi:predicted nucleic acid-binding protein
MPLPVVVPDASVLLKWVLPPADEPNADRALHLRSAILHERIQALVPSLWFYEVGNTVARRFPKQATQWLMSMMKFGLEEAPLSERWLTTALGLTARCGSSFYDAAYHAVALVHGGVYITADSRYALLAQKEGAVVLISEWQPPEPQAKRGGP